jgi:hypothetical protein
VRTFLYLPVDWRDGGLGIIRWMASGSDVTFHSFDMASGPFLDVAVLNIIIRGGHDGEEVPSRKMKSLERAPWSFSNCVICRFWGISGAPLPGRPGSGKHT